MNDKGNEIMETVLKRKYEKAFTLDKDGNRLPPEGLSFRQWVAKHSPKVYGLIFSNERIQRGLNLK